MNFRDRFSKNTEISNIMINRLVGTSLFHADRRTNMTKVIVVFQNFAKAFKNFIRKLKIL